MRVLISADLEGVSGVVHPEQLFPEGKAYKDTVSRWAAELNAVVDGLKECKVKEIVINDSHNHSRNFDISMIPDASFKIGWQRPFSMVSGVEMGYDACFFTGYHCMAGVNATLSHTYRPRIIKQVLLNNLPVGEIGLNAALAGHFNIPVVFLSGDYSTCEEGRTLLGHQLITVPTKISSSRYSALSFPFNETLKHLKEGTIKAIKTNEQWRAYKISSPCTISVTFSESNHADAAELIPNTKRISETEIEFTHEDYPTLFKCFLAMGTLATSRDDVLT